MAVDKPKISEVIVVEGIHDKQAIDRAVEADCIMTHGSALSEKTLKMIERAANTRGVIVFTDPDYVGEQLRKKIEQRIPLVKHAFLTREKAYKDQDIGIENAQPQDVRAALLLAQQRAASQAVLSEQTKVDQNSVEKTIPWSWMLDYGLIAGSDSGQRRLAIADELGIGYANGKQFWKRLVMLNIARDEFLHAVQKLAINQVGRCSDE